MNKNKLIEIYGPNQLLYQWDKGQKLLLQGYEAGTRVDFSGWGQNQAVSVYAYQENGAVFCDIPDTLLMEPNHLWGFVYETDGDRGEVVHRFALPMVPRLRPDDYVEPEELSTWHELAKRLADLEGEGLAKAVEDYLKEHSIQPGATEEEAAQIARNTANIEQLTQDKLDADRLDEAVSNALSQAKESGVFDGAPGVQGPAGPKGDKGDIGSQGPRGADGDAGADGKSAYAYARDGGFAGTEAEFAEKLAKELPDVLPNPYPLTINGKAYDGSEAVDVMITGGTAGGSTSLGQTPVTLTQSANIKLIGDGEYSYVVEGKTKADLSTATIANAHVTLTEKEGYMELTVSGSPANWYGAYAMLTIHDLTIGESYAFCIESLGIDTVNKTFNGYFLIKNASGNELGRIEDKPAGLASVTFTADTETVTVHWYPANNYYWGQGYRTALIGDLYLNKASDGTERTGVFHESGTFTDSHSFGQLPKGITITTEPSCEVYSVSAGGGAGEASAPLEGKTVVCFGDSLFGMYTGDTSAPAFVAKKTGATVHNVGFSGCRMSEHPYDTHNPFSMYALADAIASGDWSAQDATENFPDQLAILKGIDFGEVDAIVIHYGTNDFTAGEGVEIDNADNLKATNTLCGALRYSVETLLTAFPKLQIFVSLPAFRYWTADDGTVTDSDEKKNGNGHTLPEFVRALAETAKEYNLPVIDCYYGLGINRSNAATFLGDGVHHNVDGRKRFGEYIGTKLISGGDTFSGADSKIGGESAGGSASIDVTAEVGQTIVVEEVDENGKPTKWAAVDFGQAELYPQTTFNGIYNSEFGCYQYDQPGEMLQVGREYTVIFDGFRYTHTAKVFSLAGMTGVYAGNAALLGNNTGEPFCIISVDGMPSGVSTLLFDANQHTVRITTPEGTGAPYYIEATAEWNGISSAEPGAYTFNDPPYGAMGAFQGGREVKMKVHVLKNGNELKRLDTIYTLAMGGRHEMGEFLLIFVKPAWGDGSFYAATFGSGAPLPDVIPVYVQQDGTLALFTFDD